MQGLIAAVGLFCFATALLDMGMNGSRYAEWAPWGLGAAIACFLIAR